MWSNGVGKNREIDEEHDENCVEEGVWLASVKFDRDGERGREAPGMRSCSINILDGSELESAIFKKSNSYFENNILIFLLFGISNTSIFKCLIFCIE